MEWKEMAKMAEKELLQARQNLVNGKKNGVPAEDLDALKRKVQYREAVLEAIHGFGGDPLTLEQLRGMDGKPVWIFRLEDRKGWWAIIYPGKQDANTDYGGYFSFEDYGKTWLAYAYHPAHIDLEAWTAEWAEDGECDHKPYRVRDAEKWKKYKCSKCGYKAGRRTSQKFCPSCGRAMTPVALDELEKRLRG